MSNRILSAIFFLQRPAGGAGTVQPGGDSDAAGCRHNGGRPYVLLQHDPCWGGQVSAVCPAVAATYTTAGRRYASRMCLLFWLMLMCVLVYLHVWVYVHVSWRAEVVQM